MKKQLIFLMVSIFTLSACSLNGGSEEQKLSGIIQKYADCESFESDVRIISDLNERTAEYTVHYTYFKDKDDEITVKSPQDIEGIKVRIGENFNISYEDTVLETGMSPNGNGLTPVDSISSLMDDIITKTDYEFWSGNEGETEFIAEKIKFDIDKNEITKEVYFEQESGNLLYCEIFLQNKCILKLKFDNTIMV